MAENSAIEWTDHTFNPWLGCTKVSPACDHCYAEARMDTRLHIVQWGPHAERKRTSKRNWKDPVKWNNAAAAFMAEHGRRQRVFCASLADVFDNQVPQAWRDDLFALIEATPHLDWLLLTKRIGNVANMLPVPFDFARLYPNVWLGATICNQAEADRDIPKLLATDARVRFLSIEPMLGPIDLERPRPGPDLDQGGGRMICQPWLIQSGIDWVICGGESGSGARPMHPDWARSLRDQCQAAGVPFLFKQWGEWIDDDHIDSAALPAPHVADPEDFFPGVMLEDPLTMTWRVGKKAAGRLLDGIEHNGFPEPTQ